MKKVFAYITVVVMVTLCIYVHTVAKFNKNVVEIHMDNCSSTKETEEMRDDMRKQDYVTIYDVSSGEKNLKAYDGNINIYLNMNKFQAKNMNLNENEAIIGEDTVKEKNILVPLDNIIQVDGRNYDINCVVENKNFIMTRYRDDMKDSIKNQVLYMVIDSSALNYEKDIIQSVLEKNNIKTSQCLFYGDVHNTVKKVLFIFMVMDCIVLAILIYKKFRENLQKSVEFYKSCKKNMTFAGFIYNYFIKKRKFDVIIQTAILCVILGVSIILMRKLLIIKLPFNENFANIGNIVATFKVIEKRLRYKLQTGFSEFNIYVVKVSFIYIILLIVGITLCIKSLLKLIFSKPANEK
ncbi:hypothetical protein SAMN02745248_01142 [Hathewaya proteolytica DSM 3090]|uniref:Uncharacterized protein n=1 Tax=Hathewaya proteolytica DSM 3090 TaxID=1121331 RepID=A0A1M6MRY7_9CLOT|nr:hypothetical protein [Hathewaya proteolytica]SHJ86268.1 hypothetical protein SAMN02745248_01142 [Hathewaya proteolytica DSM 3090]